MVSVVQTSGRVWQERTHEEEELPSFEHRGVDSEEAEGNETLRTISVTVRDAR